MSEQRSPRRTPTARKNGNRGSRTQSADSLAREAEELRLEVTRLTARCRTNEHALEGLAQALIPLRRGAEALRAENTQLRAEAGSGGNGGPPGLAPTKSGSDEVDALTSQVRLLERLALTDSLTGLANRRAWDEQVVRELARARRFDEPLSLALLDLDDFKAYNDAHGHAAGDRALVEASRAWLRELRDIDFLCRWGGDEFAILLPNCSRPDADAVLARVVSVTPHGLTCAVGLVCWNRSDTPEAFVERADAAMYASKRREDSAALAPAHEGDDSS